jgi:hypothetical protein
VEGGHEVGANVAAAAQDEDSGSGLRGGRGGRGCAGGWARAKKKADDGQEEKEGEEEEVKWP